MSEVASQVKQQSTEPFVFLHVTETRGLVVESNLEAVKKLALLKAARWPKT